MEGVTVYDHPPECHVTFGRGGLLIILYKIPVPTLKLPYRRFQTFHEISLSEKLFGESHCPQNEIFIRAASRGVSDELLDENALGGRR